MALPDRSDDSAAAAAAAAGSDSSDGEYDSTSGERESGEAAGDSSAGDSSAGDSSCDTGATDHEQRLVAAAAGRRRSGPSASSDSDGELGRARRGGDAGGAERTPAPAACAPADEPEQAFETVLSPGAGGDWRYWDGADSLDESRQKCFNCGRPGHRAADCPYPRKQKPCFLCGEYGHERSSCPNGLCFSCMKPGHLARDCPERGSAAARHRAAPCARCGRRGHVVEKCGWRDYDAADLAAMTCYVCGETGHLVCQTSLTRLPQATCYRCGMVGHQGMECMVLAGRRGGGPNRGARGATFGSPAAGWDGGGGGIVCYRWCVSVRVCGRISSLRAGALARSLTHALPAAQPAHAHTRTTPPTHSFSNTHPRA